SCCHSPASQECSVPQHRHQLARPQTPPCKLCVHFIAALPPKAVLSNLMVVVVVVVVTCATPSRHLRTVRRTNTCCTMLPRNLAKAMSPLPAVIEKHNLNSMALRSSGAPLWPHHGFQLSNQMIHAQPKSPCVIRACSNGPLRLQI